MIGFLVTVELTEDTSDEEAVDFLEAFVTLSDTADLDYRHGSAVNTQSICVVKREDRNCTEEDRETVTRFFQDYGQLLYKFNVGKLFNIYENKNQHSGL